MINYGFLVAFNLFGIGFAVMVFFLAVIVEQTPAYRGSIDGGYLRDKAPITAPDYQRGNSGVSFTYERAA